MFGLTVCELLPAKVMTALQNHKFVMGGNSKTIVLIILKFSQSSPEPNVTSGTNFCQNLRHQGVKLEKSGMICHGMSHL